MAIKKRESVVFSVNSKVYLFESIVNAAYAFLDKAHVFLDGDPKTKIKVSLKAKESCTLSAQDLKGEFHNALLEQDLRLRLAKDNKKLREYIVGQALFGASPEQANDVTSTDEELDKILERELKALEEEEKKTVKNKKDPLGVLTAWDAKNTKKSASKKNKKGKI